jgi:hypothetical protein
MNERATQRGDGETAECHECGERFDSQAELLVHLRDAHAREGLAEAGSV